MTERGKTVVALVACAGLFGFIGWVFWYQDWRYSLPTPKPPGIEQPSVGARLRLSGLLPESGSRPVLLHFFNPSCPCSRFNLAHVRELIGRYGSQAQFIAILQGEDDAEALTAAFRNLDLGIDGIADSTGAIAAAAGVYSTPQAVILDRRGSLYYRGNYNTTRYCTNKSTEFARIALEAALAERAAPGFAPLALTAYGCPLPRKAAGQ